MSLLNSFTGILSLFVVAVVVVVVVIVIGGSGGLSNAVVLALLGIYLR